ncbi:13725_t:CDS:2, partial [Funneliformis caledonium]
MKQQNNINDFENGGYWDSIISKIEDFKIRDELQNERLCKLNNKKKGVNTQICFNKRIREENISQPTPNLDILKDEIVKDNTIKHFLKNEYWDKEIKKLEDQNILEDQIIINELKNIKNEKLKYLETKSNMRKDKSLENLENFEDKNKWDTDIKNNININNLNEDLQKIRKEIYNKLLNEKNEKSNENEIEEIEKPNQNKRKERDENDDIDTILENMNIDKKIINFCVDYLWDKKIDQILDKVEKNEIIERKNLILKDLISNFNNIDFTHNIENNDDNCIKEQDIFLNDVYRRFILNEQEQRFSVIEQAMILWKNCEKLPNNQNIEEIFKKSLSSQKKRVLINDDNFKKFQNKKVPTICKSQGILDF